MTPYEAVYVQALPVLLPYTPSNSLVQAVDAVLRILRENLHMARNRMKQQADQHCSERTFEAGDMVFLHLHPYKKSSLKLKGCHKIAPKFYGPYRIL